MTKDAAVGDCREELVRVSLPRLLQVVGNNEPRGIGNGIWGKGMGN